ncbi:hypothetical protein CPB86DRAFT_781469 [Serendipita vermifera]|nr:hypothetical protein CPB86DRAFT_781469 [Serendipita vermifera]
MPSLQALATKFYRLDEAYHDYEAHNNITDAIIRSDSVLSLVVLDDTYVTKPQSIVDALQKYIHLCKNVQGVYLSRDHPLYFKRSGWSFFHSPHPSNWWDTGAIQRLQKICKEKSVQIKYKKDGEFVDILPLSSKRI